MDEAATLCDRIGVVDRGKLIALGTPEALVQSLGTAHVVEVTFEGGTLPPGEWFTGLPGVVEARVAEGVVTLGSSAIHTTIPAVLTALAEAGAAVQELRTHSATLEDVFVALTGRHLRDG
jgi:ABC-2 type transport system ATP-binding protein